MPIETRSDHHIDPAPGTPRRTRDGEPARLLNPLDYPVDAVCAECGRLVRSDRMLYADWYHVRD